MAMAMALPYVTDYLSNWSSEHNKLAAKICTVGATGYATYRFIAWKINDRHNRSLITLKRKEVFEKKDAIMQKLVGMRPSPVDAANTICRLSVAEMREKIDSGELKIVDILEAWQAKALSVDQKTNCLNEIVFDADVNALLLDDSSSKADDKRGLLHGIPISLKEMNNLKGYDNTLGLISGIHKPATADCVVTAALKAQGAIPFMTTNMPQLGFALDSRNPIYGETVNAHNATRTSGGSSGGEGSLVGGGGSPLGFGTDLGGSVRIPACYNGICSLRPTAGRLSFAGITFPCYGAGNIAWTVGPMAPEVETLAIAMRALLTHHMFDRDPTVPPIPFNEEVYDGKRKLRIGYYTTVPGDTIAAVPAVRRGVEEAKVRLEACGHELVPFLPPDMADAMCDLGLGMTVNDGGRTLLSVFKGQVMDHSLRPLFSFMAMPQPLQYMVSLLCDCFIGRSLGHIVRCVMGSKTVDDTWDKVHAQNVYRARYNQLWKEARLDALLGPAMPFPAPPVGRTRRYFMKVAYTMVYNIINCPAGIVPVTKVTAADVVAVQQSESYPCTKDRMHRWVVEDQAGSEGLPICVQIVTEPWREELCLRVMRELEASLK